MSTFTCTDQMEVYVIGTQADKVSFLAKLQKAVEDQGSNCEDFNCDRNGSPV